jgi:hypothetical protein
MNALTKNLSRIGLSALFFAIIAMAMAQETYVTVTGVLKDAKSGDKISFASITVPGTGIGTVSNSDGEFILKVDKSLNAEYFEVSHVSYVTGKFKISEATGQGKTFTLDVQPVQLKEVPVLPRDARKIVEKAFEKIDENYSEVPNMMNGFYREYIMQRHDYISISEAVVDIYKSPYKGIQDDQVKIFKGRKGSDVKKADTLIVQLQGGPKVLLLLDIVKNRDLSISMDNLDNYTYEFSQEVNIDNKPNWVIEFSPYLAYTEPLYYGKLYICQDNYAITRAEFSLDLQDQAKAAGMFIKKKPASLTFVPTSTSYLVTYKQQEGKYYLSYMRVDLKFKCDWKKKLFKNYYSLMSEMAITNRSGDHIVKFENQDTFKSTMVFAEKVEDFKDVDFWGENNIIQPEESIENAILKLSKSMKK